MLSYLYFLMPLPAESGFSGSLGAFRAYTVTLLPISPHIQVRVGLAAGTPGDLQCHEAV